MERDDVYRSLRGLITSGAFEAGARLPSCRALSERFGSNPNTVNRALQLLQDEGLVRTLPRRGTFVADLAVTHDGSGFLEREAATFVARALAAGFDPEAVRSSVESAVSGSIGGRRVLFVECNDRDLLEMGEVVERVVGVDVDRALIDDVGAPGRLDGVDALIVPLFHVGEVRAVAPDTLPLIEVAFVPDSEPVLELASLEPDEVVVIASRSQRGLDVLSSIVRQYFRGEVRELLVGPGPADLSGYGIVVHNNGSGLTDDEVASAPRAIKLTFTIDGRSVASLRPRLERLRGRVRAAR
ncbi:MAG: GntR family transcriptional regulator [Actinomycetota bacterium]|nr:GntR family transcriptional regulator [Actinomycetota bacterium]